MRSLKRRGRAVSGRRGQKSLRRRAGALLPAESRVHLRAAVREGLLALSSLCQAAVTAVERSARGTGRRIDRIPVKGKRKKT